MTLRREHTGTKPTQSADADCSAAIAEQIRQASATASPLRIVGGNSKRFLGRAVAGEVLAVGAHRGIVNHQPEELVLTARAGTPLAELEAVLAAAGQWLPFDPPRFDGAGTLGGAVATGLAGPARPFTGAARDFVLGVRAVNGRGEVLRFGGEVMKNVAGYDLSRLLTGSFGTLGVLLEVSLKVLPAPRMTRTVAFEVDAAGAIKLFSQLRGRPLPLAGAAHLAGVARVRLAGSEAAVAAAIRDLETVHGGRPLDASEDVPFWPALRDHRLPFFRDHDRPLYRLCVPPAKRPLDLPGECLIDWAGGQRWLVPREDVTLAHVRGEARALGGHATRFRGAVLTDEAAGNRVAAGGTGKDAAAGAMGRSEVFHPLTPAVFALHARLKAAFDPHGVLNPGRQYPGL